MTDAENVPTQFLHLFNLHGLRLLFLSLAQSRQQQFRSGRVQHVDQVLGINRPCAGKGNCDLSVILRKRGRGRVTVYLNLKLTRELMESELDAAVPGDVDRGVHRLSDLES